MLASCYGHQRLHSLCSSALVPWIAFLLASFTDIEDFYTLQGTLVLLWSVKHRILTCYGLHDGRLPMATWFV